jgi:hypothetical protein
VCPAPYPHVSVGTAADGAAGGGEGHSAGAGKPAPGHVKRDGVKGGGVGKGSDLNVKDGLTRHGRPIDLAPGPEWAPFVSIHPPEIEFGKRPLCSLSTSHFTAGTLRLVQSPSYSELGTVQLN